MRQTAASEIEEIDRSRGRAVICLACRARITTESARIEVGGQHRHVCVNPSGIPFDIACFATAPGCVPHGPPESHWSWFEGFEWRVALCGACRAHLGWSFHGDGAFHGLIAGRIATAEEDEP